jgi:hypothetical protein
MLVYYAGTYGPIPSAEEPVAYSRNSESFLLKRLSAFLV